MSNMGSSGAGGSSGNVLTGVVLPAGVGALLAALLLFGLIYSQTQSPDKNPASQQILVYGD